MQYVYLVRSEAFPDERYTGVTSDLKARLADHNAGRSPHTSKFRPWRPETYLAFNARAEAEAFESRLKSGSGHAYARKRLWPEAG